MTQLHIFEISGQKFAALPLKDYEKLLADAEINDDISAFKKAKAKSSEYIPFEIVEQMLDRENHIKVYRQFRGMTQAQLAQSAKISRTYRASIETGKKPGSVSTLKKIAKVLKVDLEDIA